MIIKPLPLTNEGPTSVWQDEEANHRFLLQARSVSLLSAHHMKKLRRLSLSFVSSISSSGTAEPARTRSSPVVPMTFHSSTASTSALTTLVDSSSYESSTGVKSDQLYPTGSPPLLLPSRVRDRPAPALPPRNRRSENLSNQRPGIGLGASASEILESLVENVQKSTTATQQSLRQQFHAMNMNMNASMSALTTLPEALAAKSNALGRMLDDAVQATQRVASLDDATFRIVLQCSQENYVVALAVDEAMIRADWACIHKTVFPKVSVDTLFSSQYHSHLVH
jgi:hypothetical protein